MVRTSQFLLVPFLALCSFTSGMVLLLAGQQGIMLLLAAAAFAVPAVPLLVPFYKDCGVVRTGVGVLRWAVLVVYVLLMLHRLDESAPTSDIVLPDDVT